MGLDGEHRKLVSGVLARLTAMMLVALAGSAQACEIALAFAIDVSASVDTREYELQIDGLAQALRHPAVEQAVLAQEGGVAFAAYEWSGRDQQWLAMPWTRIASAAGLALFAEGVGAHVRMTAEFPTSIGYALSYGAVLMRDAPPCRRRVIDVSGDGVSNDGYPPASAYRAFAGDFAGITVNGLAIEGSDHHVVAFYRDEVIRGPDAFVEIALGFEDFARAMRVKLLRELFGGQVATR